jgi:hypothetical protein
MPESSPEAPQSQKPPNGLVSVLSSLATSGNKWVQFGTLGLIGLSGVGNWVATWNSANQNRQEIEVSRRVNWEGQERVRAEVVRQIEEIHSWMQEATDEFHKGNADSAVNRKLLTKLMRDDLESYEQRQQAALDNQQKIMAAQSKILENDSTLIRETHKIVTNLEEWKRSEQMRGAPP